MSGIEYYLPLRKEFRQWSDRIKKIIVPAFPSYIFVHVNQNEYYQAINLRGMVKYIHFGGIPASVSENTIDNIKKIVEINSIPKLCDKLPSLGEKYKIPSGPLKGFEGNIIRLKGETHFYIELKEWGKYIMLSFSAF
jgi:transcription antitermination factor NusG